MSPLINLMYHCWINVLISCVTSNFWTIVYINIILIYKLVICLHEYAVRNTNQIIIISWSGLHIGITLIVIVNLTLYNKWLQSPNIHNAHQILVCEAWLFVNWLHKLAGNICQEILKQIYSVYSLFGWGGCRIFVALCKSSC